MMRIWILSSMKMMTKPTGLIILVLLASFLTFEFTTLDIVIQDYFYNFSTQQWVLDRNAAIPKLVFYDGIKLLYFLFVLGIFIILLFFRKKHVIVQYKKGLAIVLLSCIAVPLLIGFLKATTNVPCPKDISHYGGNYPYITVLSKYPATFQQTKNIKCYPAGHASGGFALMSLFFLFSSRRNKKIALISTIIIGWTIGSYKMIIGDHFFSHTLITMMLSWLLILSINYMIGRFCLHRCK